jgi:hypothetical protein
MKPNMQKMTRVSPGLYRDASGKLVRKTPNQAFVNAPAPSGAMQQQNPPPPPAAVEKALNAMQQSVPDGFNPRDPSTWRGKPLPVTPEQMKQFESMAPKFPTYGGPTQNQKLPGKATIGGDIGGFEANAVDRHLMASSQAQPGFQDLMFRFPPGSPQYEELRKKFGGLMSAGMK